MALFANNCQNAYEKQVIFKCFQKPQIKIKLCVRIALFLYFSKNNFKVGGSTRFLGGIGGKIGLNVEKVIFSRLKLGLFKVVHGTSERSTLHLF